jgi:hypothetical protein
MNYSIHFNGSSVHRFFMVLFAVVFVGSLVFLLPAKPTQAIGYLTIKVTDPQCPGYTVAGTKWDYSDIDTAVKDTIPMEWWPASLLGGTITYSGLQTAAVIVRSRVKWERDYGVNGDYHYSTANSNTRVSSTPQGCDSYTMNTVPNARSSYSNSSYNSNLATDQTANNYIVDISGNVNMVGFHPAAQYRSTVCAEQSNDWKFCAVSALAEEVGSSNNKLSRRLNTMPTDKIRFEAEAFTVRLQPASGRYWFCYTGDVGFLNKCYMQAVPNNGTIIRSNQNYIINSLELSYKVAFPVMALAPNRQTYYVWVRGMGCSATDKSVHTGLNTSSTLSANSDDMTGWNGCSYTWIRQWIDYNNPCPCPSGNAYIQVQWDDFDGSYETFNIWMREDGMRVDRIILTTNVNYNPNNDPGFANGY